jgi:hypothetical protein
VALPSFLCKQNTFCTYSLHPRCTLLEATLHTSHMATLATLSQHPTSHLTSHAGLPTTATCHLGLCPTPACPLAHPYALPFQHACPTAAPLRLLCTLTKSLPCCYLCAVAYRELPRWCRACCDPYVLTRFEFGIPGDARCGDCWRHRKVVISRL